MSEQIEKMDKIDKAMAVEATVSEPDVVFYDVRKEPFAVYGLYDYRNEPDFKRLPDEVANTVNKGVAGLAYHTAGGRVRFSTDSDYVAIRAEMPKIGRMPHFALTGSSAFDLYVDDPQTGITRFYKEFRPAFDFTGGYESIVRFGEKKLRHFTVHFPSYSRVRNLQIGLQQGAALGLIRRQSCSRQPGCHLAILSLDECQMTRLFLQLPHQQNKTDGHRVQGTKK